MISTEVFCPADEESSRYGSSASGSPSTPWPTGNCTAVGRAGGGRWPAPAHAPLTAPKTCGPTTRRSTTPEGNSRGLETPPNRRTRRSRRHHCGCGAALPRRRHAGGAAAARRRTSSTASPTSSASCGSSAAPTSVTRVLDLAVVTDFVDTLHALPPSPAASAFDQFLAPADDAARHALAVGLLTRSRTVRVMLPRLRIATAGLSAAATRTVREVERDLCKPAQSDVDVLRRGELLLRSHPGRVSDSPGLCHARQRRSTVPRTGCCGLTPTRSTPPCSPSWETHSPGRPPQFGGVAMTTAPGASPPGASPRGADLGVRPRRVPRPYAARAVAAARRARCASSSSAIDERDPTPPAAAGPSVEVLGPVVCGPGSTCGRPLSMRTPFTGRSAPPNGTRLGGLALPRQGPEGALIRIRAELTGIVLVHGVGVLVGASDDPADLGRYGTDVRGRKMVTAERTL